MWEALLAVGRPCPAWSSQSWSLRAGIRRWPHHGRQGHRRKAPALAQHGKDVLPRLYGHSDRGYIAYG